MKFKVRVSFKIDLFFKVFKNQINGFLAEFYQQFQEAKNLHKIFLESSKENVQKLAEIKYFLSSKQISSILMLKFFKLDLFKMVCGIVLSILTSFAILISLLTHNEYTEIKIRNIGAIITLGLPIYYIMVVEMFDQTGNYQQALLIIVFQLFSYVNFCICYQNLPDKSMVSCNKIHRLI